MASPGAVFLRHHPLSPARPAQRGTAAAAATRAPTRVRPEIQALRAVAVLLVLVYHFWPAAIPGGYVGVDVFFVISGFLITSLLLREIDRTGSASATRFWARRARRLLPASLATLLFVAVMTIAFVPMHYWDQYFADVRASTAYVQNWHLAGTAVDYFAADNAPSPVQHFWSLSAEEQFYFLWPPMILIGVWLTRGRRPRVQRRAIALVMGTITLASLAYGLYATAATPASAYFGTPTRAWEFGAGGLLSLIPATGRGSESLRAAGSWAGLALIVVAAFAFSAQTPFPGSAALVPVLGAVLVIRAGMPRPRWSPAALLRLRAMQFTGDISYSLYLWHWPLLILAPFVIGTALSTATKVALVGLTFAAAWASKVYVEDPVRERPLLVARPARWTFAAAAAGMVLVLAVLGGGGLQLEREVRASERASQRILAADPDCFAAAARDARNPCSNPRLVRSVIPTPVEAKRTPAGSPCEVTGSIAGKKICAFGVPAASATATIALVGDSHAGHWRPALDVLARENRWRGIAIGHHGCPLSKAVKRLPQPARGECETWKAAVFDWFARHPEVDTVFVSQFAGGSDVVTRAGEDPFEAAAAGYRAAWAALLPTVERIVVIRDTPKVRGNTDDCVQRALDAGRRAAVACAVPRRRALDRDPAADAVVRMRSSRVRIADLTDFFCDRRDCFPVIGGALVHKDTSHLTPLYARSLAPYLQRQVRAALAPGRRETATTSGARMASASARAPRCFGAAARDPKRTCRLAGNPTTVRPTPQAAKRPGKDTCRVIERIKGKQVCGWGVPAERAVATVALVGDSHAGHWRPALEKVAAERRWRGISLGHSGCPFSKATKLIPEPDRSHCVSWKNAVFRWFERHPEVTIVFTGQFAGGTTVARRPGESAYAAEVGGYAAAYAALPPSVEQIVVLRDTPKVRGNTDTCVERAIARGRSPGRACAVARRRALEPDPAATAARRDRGDRADVADLSSFFCDRRRCFPVVGGALVHKDTSHITGTFAQTLAPFLARELARVVPGGAGLSVPPPGRT